MACKIYVATGNYVLATYNKYPHKQTHTHTHLRVRHADTLQGYASKGHCLEPVETKVASGRKAARKAVKAKDTTKLPPTLKPRLALLPLWPGCACRVRYLNPSCPKLSADPPSPDIGNMILVFSNLNFKQVII